MKLILSTEFAPFLAGRLPADVQIVWADQNGNLDGDASDAEVYFNPGLLKPDVTEPLPSDHPLWSAPNLFVTPHISWSSRHTRRRTVDLFLDNLHRYCTGQPLRNVVDRVAGY